MTDGFGLARGGVRKAADLDFLASSNGFFLGQTERSHLWLTIRTARNLRVINWRRMTDDLTNRSFTFKASLVRQQLFARDVANGVDPRDAGELVRIDGDEAAFVEFHSRFIKRERFGIGQETNRDQNFFNFDDLGLTVLFEVHRNDAWLLFQLHDFRTRANGDAFFGELTFDDFRNLVVFNRQHLIKHFDHGDFGAQRR